MIASFAGVWHPRESASPRLHLLGSLDHAPLPLHQLASSPFQEVSFLFLFLFVYFLLLLFLVLGVMHCSSMRGCGKGIRIFLNLDTQFFCMFVLIFFYAFLCNYGKFEIFISWNPIILERKACM